MKKSLKALFLLIPFLLSLVAHQAHAALSASNIVEIRSAATAGNLGGGFFNTANANFITDYTTDTNTGNTASPVLSSATYNFQASDDEAWVFVQAGTNWYSNCFFRIDSVASNKATLDAAIGNGICLSNNRWIPSTVAGVASVGTPTSGTVGIDYSQQDAAELNETDLASVDGTTNPCTVTSAGLPFGRNHAGNGLRITAGTNWTQAFYEIVSVSAVTATLDKACGSAATLTSGTAYLGGALSLGSSDDAVWEIAVSSATAATRFFFKGNATYTLGGTVTNSKSGNTLWPIIFEGYATKRGDRPTDSTRPVLDGGAAALTWCGTGCEVHNLRGKSTSSSSTSGTWMSAGAERFMVTESEVINPTGGAIYLGSGTYGPIIGNFIQAPSSFCIKTDNGSTQSSAIIIGNHMKGCDTGILADPGNATGMFVANNIFEGVNTAGLDIDYGDGGRTVIIGNTIYGAEGKDAIGIDFAAASEQAVVMNNILYGLTTGITHGDATTNNYSDYNDYFNNTTDVTAGNWVKGSHDLAVNPTFALVVRSGATATTTAGNHLVQSGATFQTWGVVAGDILRVLSGTGPTAKLYTISSVDSETQVTTTQTLTANATADKVWEIITTDDMSIGSPVKAVAYPGIFSGGLTTGYRDMGAVQSQGSGGSCSAGN